MYREIVVQVADEETKVAVLEDNQVVEVYVERAPDQRLAGNIYKGVTRNVLPGMQAAFIDVGLGKNAFLYVEDALVNTTWQMGDGHGAKDGVRPNISDVIKEGQEVVVQIVKEPVGTKGARVTTQITLPGRYLVLMPAVDYVGISRRIVDEVERERLKEIADAIKPEQMGLIVRTVAEGAAQEELEADIASLLDTWQRILRREENVAGPALIHRDVDLVGRIIRDVFSDDIQKLSVNSRAVLDRIFEFADEVDAHLKSKVFLSDTDNLFAKYAVDYEIAQALKSKVWLNNGGYLIIDQVEALTAIDVNTGKFVGTTTLADTVLKTNLEAAAEIARQLRLRNIGGIIIIDFIDMQDEQHKEAVLNSLAEELKKDKIKAHILGITPLGLVELTRKKVGQSLSSTMEKTCPYCNGKGRVLSEETVFLALKKDLRETATVSSANTLLVEVHPLVAEYLTKEGGTTLQELESEMNVNLVLQEKDGCCLEKYDINPIYSRKSR